MVGPRGDGYRPWRLMDLDEASAYHRQRIDAFALAAADTVTAYTLADTGEVIGVVQAPCSAGLPRRSPSPSGPTPGFPAAFPSPRP